MDAKRVTLNALLRGREWKTSNHAVFVRVCDERSFTREVRVARVAAGVWLTGIHRQGCQERTTRSVRPIPVVSHRSHHSQLTEITPVYPKKDYSFPS
jgi:hypothetical protein